MNGTKRENIKQEAQVRVVIKQDQRLLSDEIINGRFSKVVILTDSLTSNWNISLHTHDNYAEVPKDSINSIDVKPYSYTVLLTKGLGIFLVYCSIFYIANNGRWRVNCLTMASSGLENARHEFLEFSGL